MIYVYVRKFDLTNTVEKKVWEENGAGLCFVCRPNPLHTTQAAKGQSRLVQCSRSTVLVRVDQRGQRPEAQSALPRETCVHASRASLGPAPASPRLDGLWSGRRGLSGPAPGPGPGPGRLHLHLRLRLLRACAPACDLMILSF